MTVKSVLKCGRRENVITRTYSVPNGIPLLRNIRRMYWSEGVIVQRRKYIFSCLRRQQTLGKFVRDIRGHWNVKIFLDFYTFL